MKMKSWLDRLPAWTLSVVCFLAICWLTLAPHPLPENDIPLFPGADKIVHGIMFGGFTLCIILDGLRRKGWPPYPENKNILYLSPVIPCVTGIVTEILQEKMHVGRYLEIGDMISDIVGAILVAVVAIMMARNARQY